MNYANQRRASTANKETVEPKAGEQFIGAVTWDVVEKASQLLTGNGFKVYMYLLKWRFAEHYWFSPQDIINRFGVGGRRSIERALEDLEFHGFLEKKDTEIIFHPISITEP